MHVMYASSASLPISHILATHEGMKHSPCHCTACVLYTPSCAAPGDPSWRLLDIDQSLFRGDIGSSLGYPDEARLGSLNDRGKTGYIEHAAVLAAYRKVCELGA